MIFGDSVDAGVHVVCQWLAFEPVREIQCECLSDMAFDGGAQVVVTAEPQRRHSIEIPVELVAVYSGVE